MLQRSLTSCSEPCAESLIAARNGARSMTGHVLFDTPAAAVFMPCLPCDTTRTNTVAPLTSCVCALGVRQGSNALDLGRLAVCYSIKVLEVHGRRRG